MDISLTLDILQAEAVMRAKAGTGDADLIARAKESIQQSLDRAYVWYADEVERTKQENDVREQFIEERAQAVEQARERLEGLKARPSV